MANTAKAVNRAENVILEAQRNVDWSRKMVRAERKFAEVRASLSGRKR